MEQAAAAAAAGGEERRAPPWLSVAMSLVPPIFAVITVLGVAGNALVIVVFVVNRALQSATNALIINLAVADLCFLVLCVPFTAFAYLRPGEWPFGALLCHAQVFCQHVSAYASVWTLVVLSLDRYLVSGLARPANAAPLQAVVHPVWALDVRCLRNTLAACLLVWALSLVSNVGLTRTSGVFRYEFDGANRSACVDFLDIARLNATKRRVLQYYLSFNATAYVLPLAVICVLYLLMLRRIWKAPRLRKLSIVDVSALNRRITCMIVSVTITFALCWLPQNVRFTIYAFTYPEMTVGWTFQVCAQLLAYTNSCVNPILYGVLSENFRLGGRNLASMVRCRDPQHVIRRASNEVALRIFSGAQTALSRSAGRASAAVSWERPAPQHAAPSPSSQALRPRSPLVGGQLRLSLSPGAARQQAARSIVSTLSTEAFVELMLQQPVDGSQEDIALQLLDRHF